MQPGFSNILLFFSLFKFTLGKFLRTPHTNLDANHGEILLQDELPWHTGRPVDVALTAVLTAGKDKQLGIQWKADAISLGSWPESVRHFNMHGLVLHDGGFSNDFVRDNSDDMISFLDTTRTTMYPNSSWQKAWQGLTINDERFFIAGAFLEAHQHELDYVVLTDSRDVVFGRNPFNLMRAMDKAMNTTYVFVQDEWRPNLDLEIPGKNLTAWERMTGYYHMCFGGDMPPRWTTGQMLNCGALGGHVTAMISLLKSMRANYAKVRDIARPLMCDMPVVQRAVFEDFHDLVVSGYPFNGKFKHADKNEVAAVLHKSFDDVVDDIGSRHMTLPYMNVLS